METKGVEVSRTDINLLMTVLFEVVQQEGWPSEQNRLEVESLRKRIGLCQGDMKPFQMVFVPTENFSEWFNTQREQETNDEPYSESTTS